MKISNLTHLKIGKKKQQKQILWVITLPNLDELSVKLLIGDAVRGLADKELVSLLIHDE